MDQKNTRALALFKLLAREWTIGSPITSMCFNANQSAVGFALQNGSVAIASTYDDDPPGRRIHVSVENGRSTIHPRTKLPEPLKSIEVSADREVQLASIGEAGFVAFNGIDEAIRVTPNGETAALNLDLVGQIAAASHCPTSRKIAFVSGSQVNIYDEASGALIYRMDEGKPVSAVALSPDGNSVAVAHDLGLTVWQANSDEQKSVDFAFCGRPKGAIWSPDGVWIASPLSDGGFQLNCVQDRRTRALTNYPTTVDSISWNQQANAVTTSGAFRIAAWSMDAASMEDPSSGALETGKAGLVPVSAVASHPSKNLVAAGYENGFITVAQIGRRDEVILNDEDHGAVRCLEWSRDGECIAAGTAQGLAALISLPPQMFK